MWATIVSNSDNLARHLQAAFSEAVAYHPVLMVGAVAAVVALAGTVWIIVLQSEIDQLRAQMTESRPIRLRR